MPTCPNGHQSVSDDWCEVCGHRMAGAGAPAGAVPPPPPPAPGYGYPGGDPNATAQAELCPQCRTPREALAPFCEECRWNFLTNTATSYQPPAPQGMPGPPPGLNLPPGFQTGPGPQGPPPMPQAPQPPDPFDYQGSRPSQMNRPAEPLSSDPGHHQGPPPPPPAFTQPGPPQPPGPQAGPPAPGPQPGPPAPPAFLQQGPPPVPQAPQQPGADDWMLPPPSHAQSASPMAPPAPHAPQQPQPHALAPQQHQPPQAPQQFPGQPPLPPHLGGPQQAPPQAPQQQQFPGQPPQFQAQPPAPAGWTAVIGPDREYFLAMMQRSGPEASGLNLPAYSPEQHLPLDGNQVTIGRRRHSTGESPDIDLSVPPEDPGVSHQHAVLVQQADGSWAVVDQNSTNGTTVNGAEEPIQPYVPIPLQDGDRVHVGAWTTITVRRGRM